VLDAIFRARREVEASPEASMSMVAWYRSEEIFLSLWKYREFKIRLAYSMLEYRSSRQNLGSS
jgi:hypothetical protein